jgi:DNA polymerase-3 subunit gamma/tau
LPETILSRCQRFDFRRISLREIVLRLKEIAESEGLQMTEGALLVVAREADGSMRDAQSLLEQILSYAGPASTEKESRVEIEEYLLEDILGVAPRTILYEISKAVIHAEPGRCLELVAKVAQDGLDMARLCRDLVEHFRNLLVVRLAQQENQQVKTYGMHALIPLVDLPDQEIEDLRQQAGELSIETLMDYFRFLAEGEEEVGRSSYPRFALEAVLVRLATLPQALSVTDAVQRLEILERKIAGGQEKNESAQPAKNKDNAGPASGLQMENPPVESDAEKLRLWRTFVDFVMKEKRFLGSHLEKVCPLEIMPGHIKIGVEDRHHLSYLKDAENLTFLKELARRFFSCETNVTVSPSMFEESGAGGQSDRPAKPNHASEPDMVKEAMRIFGGSIKETKGGGPRVS